MPKYYIISLRHSTKQDKYLTLWRPNNAGYCLSKENAGLYDEYKPGYHDNAGDMPITTEQADKLFEPTIYDGRIKEMIPYNKRTLDILGLKQHKKDLIKK